MKKTFIGIWMVGAMFLTYCGGAGASTTSASCSTVISDFYNMFEPVITAFNVVDDADLSTRLGFYDAHSTFDFTNASTNQTYYNTWNPVIGTKTTTEVTNALNDSPVVDTTALTFSTISAGLIRVSSWKTGNASDVSNIKVKATDGTDAGVGVIGAGYTTYTITTTSKTIIISGSYTYNGVLHVIPTTLVVNGVVQAY